MELKDEFNRTSPGEVFALTFVVPAASLLLTLITAVLPFITIRLRSFLECILLNIALLLCMTYLSNHLVSVLSVFSIAILIVGISFWKKEFKKQPHNKSIIFTDTSALAPSHLTEDFVRDYRGHLLLATAISILGVDFDIYPQKFSKSETYGWSVMDAGVGSFVFIHGVCSSAARTGDFKGFGKSLSSSLPLLVLGFARLLAVTAVGYHTSISEYGIHWNFFFTLALTKIVCSFILCCFPTYKIGLPMIGILVVHQWLLCAGGFTNFILNDDRSNYISANKEGICSLFGFIAIYFEGVLLGLIIWTSRHTIGDYWNLLKSLCLIGLCGWISMYFFHDMIQPISRRMANLPYCIWVVSLTSLQLAIHLFLHLIVITISQNLTSKVSQCLISSQDCLLWKAINYNGLFYFLVANLLTGFVNLYFNTHSDNTKPFLILVTYLSVLTIIVTVMHRFSIRIKFW